MYNVRTSEALKYHFRMFRWMGISPPKKFRIIYYAYSVMLHGTFSVLYPASVLLGLIGLTSFKPIVENLNLSTSILLSAVKFLNIFLMRHQLAKLIKISKELDESIVSDKEEAVLKKTVRTCHKFFYGYLFLYSGVALTGGGTSLFAQERRLMVPAWLPFDWTASELNYVAAFLFQFVGLFVIAIENVCNDSYAPFLIYMANGHLDTLYERILRIGRDTRKSQKEHYSDLVGAITEHKLIIEFVRILENVVSVVIFVQFFVSALNITVIGLCVIHTNIILSEAVFLANYLTALIVEIFIFSFYGTEFSEKASQMTTVLYSCNWVDQDTKFKRALIIFMQRTQKTSMIRGGHWIPVSLPVFLSIIKMSYSAFLVFSSMTKK